MKRFISLLISIIATCAVCAQVSTQNYIRNRKMLNNTGSSYVDEINYFDGLGRPFQVVNKAVQNNEVKERLATLREYDYYGREASNWLPASVNTDYAEATTLKNAAIGSNGYNDNYPYNQSVYEVSPLNRPLQQYGPGSLWYNNNRSVKTEYLANTTTGDKACKLYTVNGNSLAGGTTYYAANLLNIVKTTDEDNNASYTFTDMLGRTVLTRQMEGAQAHDTYYVYNDRGDLYFVLQPMYQTTPNLELYAFQYEYDGHGNCTQKKLPGMQHVEYTYNDNDRLTFSQDGNQRANSRWMYYLYDVMGRLTQQGECSSQSASSNSVILVQNYYDNYNFIGSTGFPTATYTPGNTNGNGSLTGSTVTVLGSNEKIYRAYYYDSKGRVVKSIQNNLLGGYNITNTAYTFNSKPTTVTLTHTATGKTTRTEVYTYTYDYADRVSKVEHTLNGAKVTLANNTYDNLGRLSGKSLHGSATNKLTYAYNIRSWLTGITSTKFNQNLYYADGNNATKCYNGNISSMTWKVGDEATVRGYKLTYDGLSRLAAATYGETAAISTNLDRFTEKVSGYDKNGNITALQRYGQTAASAYGLIDNLTYTLSGNQLNRVDDAITASAYNGGFEFKNGASAAKEYTYDANGNLTIDLNKGITKIQYNVLNLPRSITFSDGSITYLYSADGTKLRTIHKTGSTTTTTDYCGNVIYENGSPKQLLTEEGYVSLSDNKYHYYLKDHQGNNRVVINQTGAVEETNHYYPFGGVYAGTGNVQPYKYNGKELDTKKGLNWYDYGARHYDAALGRFHTNDRFTEKYYSMSTYQYGANNPVNNIDVNGDSIIVMPNANGIVDQVKSLFGFDTQYQKMVKNDLQQLRKDDAIVKDMIVRLEKSEYNIVITDISRRRIEKGETGNIAYPNNSKNISSSQGSTIEFSPYNNRTKNGSLRFPKIGLVHELGHADDFIQGRGIGYNMKSARSGNIQEQLNWMQAEEYPLQMENRIRSKEGLPSRTLENYFKQKP